MSAENRWSKFWWQDWQRDPALRMCSVAARGAWMDLLCIAHEGEPYGHVTVNGKAPSMRQMAAIIGVPEAEAKKLIAEMEDAGVFSRTEDGVIYSRRMVRDKGKSEAFREIGRRGGNPKLTTRENGSDKPHANGQDKLTDKPRVNPNPPPRPNHQEAEAEAEAEAEKKETLPSVVSRARDARGVRLAADWNPGSDGAEFARNLGLDPKSVFARFRDYWIAQPGEKGRKTDWQATWRNWCRKEAPNAAPAPKPAAQPSNGLFGGQPSNITGAI